MTATVGTMHQELTFELTERSLMSDPAKAKITLDEFSPLGIRLAIDDFGTGYSSLSYLQTLPVDEIKIDKSFINGLTTDPRAEHIVRSIINLGDGLGVTVVAEGIEDEDIWNALARLGCDLGQGYHVAKPMPAGEIAGWLARSARFSAPDCSNGGP